LSLGVEIGNRKPLLPSHWAGETETMTIEGVTAYRWKLEPPPPRLSPTEPTMFVSIGNFRDREDWRVAPHLPQFWEY